MDQRFVQQGFQIVNTIELPTLGQEKGLQEFLDCLLQVEPRCVGIFNAQEMFGAAETFSAMRSQSPG